MSAVVEMNDHGGNGEMVRGWRCPIGRAAATSASRVQQPSLRRRETLFLIYIYKQNRGKSKERVLPAFNRKV
jgi:hypothetical protein